MPQPRCPLSHACGPCGGSPHNTGSAQTNKPPSPPPTAHLRPGCAPPASPAGPAGTAAPAEAQTWRPGRRRRAPCRSGSSRAAGGRRLGRSRWAGPPTAPRGTPWGARRRQTARLSSAVQAGGRQISAMTGVRGSRAAARQAVTHASAGRKELKHHAAGRAICGRVIKRAQPRGAPLASRSKKASSGEKVPRMTSATSPCSSLHPGMRQARLTGRVREQQQSSPGTNDGPVKQKPSREPDTCSPMQSEHPLRRIEAFSPPCPAVPIHAPLSPALPHLMHRK